MKQPQTVTNKGINSGAIIVAVGLVGAVWYLVFRFVPPVPTPHELGNSDAQPDDLQYGMASTLHILMRQCFKKHTLTDYLTESAEYIKNDLDFEKLFNAFGEKPYDRCWYELNLPDFMYPKLDLFQWMYEFADSEDRAGVNAYFESKGIKYRI